MDRFFLAYYDKRYLYSANLRRSLLFFLSLETFRCLCPFPLSILIPLENIISNQKRLLSLFFFQSSAIFNPYHSVTASKSRASVGND